MHLGYSRSGSSDILSDMISQSAALGYKGMQLKGQHSPWLGDTDTFREKFDVSQVMGIITYGSDEQKLRDNIDFAGELGLAAVTWVPLWRREQVNEEAYKAAAEALNRFGEYAKEKGTRLSWHNHSGQIFQDDKDLAEFCRFVQPEYAGLTLDTAHLALGGVADIGKVIRDCKDHIDLFHLKDTKDREFCPLGTGELNFDEIFEAIRDIAFKGWLVIDDESDQASREEAPLQAMNFMKTYV